MNLRSPLLALLGTFTALPAQEPLTAKSFLPADHDTVVAADLKRMRDAGVWDELDHSVLSMVFRQMEKEIGFELDALDRVTVVMLKPDTEEKARSASVMPLILFEGNAPLGWPPAVTGSSRYTALTIGKHDCYVHSFFGSYQEVLALPTPELRVVGPQDIVEAALTGHPPNGRPKADLLSLLSGRGDNLAYAVVAIGTPEQRRGIRIDLIRDTKWPDDDQPTYFMLRLQAVGDPDDPHLQVEGVLRHQLGKQGLEVSDKAVQELIAGMKAAAKIPAMKAVWEKLQLERSGIDLVARIDLGRVRDAIGTVAQLAGPLFGEQGTGEAKVEAPVPAPKGGEKR